MFQPYKVVICMMECWFKSMKPMKWICTCLWKTIEVDWWLLIFWVIINDWPWMTIIINTMNLWFFLSTTICVNVICVLVLGVCIDCLLDLLWLNSIDKVFYVPLYHQWLSIYISLWNLSVATDCFNMFSTFCWHIFFLSSVHKEKSFFTCLFSMYLMWCVALFIISHFMLGIYVDNNDKSIHN